MVRLTQCAGSKYDYSRIVLHQTRQQIDHLISLQIIFKFRGEWNRPDQPCRMTNGVTTPDHTFPWRQENLFDNFHSLWCAEKLPCSECIETAEDKDHDFNELKTQECCVARITHDTCGTEINIWVISYLYIHEF